MLHCHSCEFLKFCMNCIQVCLYISLVCSLFCSSQKPIVISRYEGLLNFHCVIYQFIKKGALCTNIHQVYFLYHSNDNSSQKKGRKIAVDKKSPVAKRNYDQKGHQQPSLVSEHFLYYV